MRPYIATIIVMIMLFLIGCIASLKDYPRESCTRLPTEDVVKVIQDNCVRCHSKDFKTNQDICERKSLITDAVANNRMPKIGKLTAGEKNTIIAWK
jgi:hypothetical protein